MGRSAIKILEKGIKGMAFAFVFPGQGSQFVGMIRELVEEYDVVRQTFIQASSVLGYDLLDVCLQGPKERMD